MSVDNRDKDTVELEVTGTPARPARHLNLGKVGDALKKHFEQYPDLLAISEAARQDELSSPNRSDL